MSLKRKSHDKKKWKKKKRNKMVSITFELNKELGMSEQELRKLAHSRGMSLQQFLRYVIRMAMVSDYKKTKTNIKRKHHLNNLINLSQELGHYD